MRTHIKLITGLITLGFIGAANPVTAHASDDTSLQEIHSKLTFINAEIASRQTTSTPLLVTNLVPINEDYTNKLRDKAKRLRRIETNLKTKTDANKAKYLNTISQLTSIQELSQLTAERDKKANQIAKQQEADKKAALLKKAEDDKKIAADKMANEIKNAKDIDSNQQSNNTENNTENNTNTLESLTFDKDGLLNETATPAAQKVINLLIGIPGHSNGSEYHKSTGLDNDIDKLTTLEAVYVIHRIEGAGFGQTGAGYAGYDTPESHQNFVRQQIEQRFNGNIKSLLKSWGTYSYGGY